MQGLGGYEFAIRIDELHELYISTNLSDLKKIVGDEPLPLECFVTQRGMRQNEKRDLLREKLGQVDD